MTRAIVILVLMGGGPLVACVERPLLGDNSSSTSGNGGETSGVPTSAGESGTTGLQPGATSSSTGPQPGSTTGSTGAESTTCGFVCETTNSATSDTMCDTFKQDCPEGEKCAIYAEGGGSSWNATKCVPVTGDGKPGEPCMAMGGGVSGLDDCAKGVMCWDVDDMGQGICFALCTGSGSMPVCVDDNFSCAVTGDSILNICLPNCDLLLQDCQGEDLCIPIGDTGVCVLDASGADAGAVFDPCEFVNACDKGLLCFDPAAAVECDANAVGCCVPMCDLDLPDPMCPGAGQSCVPLFPGGDVAPKYAHVGVCMIEV